MGTWVWCCWPAAILKKMAGTRGRWDVNQKQTKNRINHLQMNAAYCWSVAVIVWISVWSIGWLECPLHPPSQVVWWWWSSSAWSSSSRGRGDGGGSGGGGGDDAVGEKGLFNILCWSYRDREGLKGDKIRSEAVFNVVSRIEVRYTRLFLLLLVHLIATIIILCRVEEKIYPPN